MWLRSCFGLCESSRQRARARGTHVDEVGVKRVDVVQARKVGQDLGELVVVVHVGELDLPHGPVPGLDARAAGERGTGTHLADPNDVVARVHNRRCLALGLTEDHINKGLQCKPASEPDERGKLDAAAAQNMPRQQAERLSAPRTWARPRSS
eukprot:1356750-Prymnesium_polylepis.2